MSKSLAQWVQAMRETGMSDNEIRSQLLQAGWAELDIRETLSRLGLRGASYGSGQFQPSVFGQGFFWGYFSIVTSAISVLYSVFLIISSSSDWVSKSIYAMASIINIGQIIALIKREKWAFYCVIPGMILGIALTMMVFQELFNTVNIFLNMFGGMSSIGMSSESLARILLWSVIGYIVISLAMNIPWIIYLNNRLVGHYSKLYLAMAIVLSVLVAAGVIWHEQQSVSILQFQ